MTSYAKRVYYNDVLKPRKSVNGFYSSWPCSSGEGTSGNMTLQWNNVQSLSTKHFMNNFMVDLEFKVEFTSPADTGGGDKIDGAYVYLNKDINNAFSTLVTLSGGLSKETPGYVCNLYKTYSERYKSVPDLDKQDLYFYEDGDNCSVVAGHRGVQIADGNVSSYFTFKTCVPLYHEFLMNGVGGVTGLSIRINVSNNLFNLFDCDNTLFNSITDLKVTCLKADLCYTNIEGVSDTYDILIPHFESFYVNATGGSVVAQTRSTESCPNRVFQFLAQNPSTAQIGISMKKPMKINNVNLTVNGASNAFNTSSDIQLFNRCKSYEACPYLGALSDWFNKDVNNEFGCVVCYDMGYLNINQSTHETFRFASTVEYSTITAPSNLYLYTIYMYTSILHLSPTGCENKFAADMIGEIDEFEGLEDDLLIGAGIFDKFKSWWRSGGPSRLIDKGKQIVDVVAPGSKTSNALNTASQISNILTGSSTQIF